MTYTTERLAMLVFLAVLLIATIMDIWQDISAGDAVQQIVLDIVVVSAIAALGVYIFLLEPLKVRRENMRLANDVEEQQIALGRASNIARKHLDGLGIYIKAQFESWGLTAAEQEVALLLLKGLSMKEISKLRDVSERTIRQQATTVYSKSNLTGRAHLSAFFLEDLLLPS
ncbi:helix-turn-helix transcriptional regulator [Planktotalea sp.]|uniref:helix-turn-helix transcriptional regulator n=1 Tax=Planktotalea sp. TaxID=2029877 RepID=UPI0032995581